MTDASLGVPSLTKSCNCFPFKAFKRFVIASLSACAPTSFKSLVMSSAAISQVTHNASHECTADEAVDWK